MENKMLAIKVFDVDYSFIIKNYLDEKLWQKEWTIFIYKRFKVSLRLDSIITKEKGIWFEVIIDDTSENNKDYFGRRKTNIFKYMLSVDNIDILKKKLNRCIFQLIKTLEEESYIYKTNEWLELSELQYEEEDRLKEIANDFLDNENVSNDEIREAFIDYYINNNSKIDNLKNDYLENMQYQVITDLYVAFLEAIKDNELLELIKQKIGNSKLEEVIKEIKKYNEYIQTEEFETEMKENLEEV